MIKILFLASNPLDTPSLKLDEEVRAIDEKLHQAEFRDVFEIKQHWAVRIDDLPGHLLRHKPHIVHFSGHGSESSEIVLKNECGYSQPVPAKALSKLFSVFKNDIRCVVLNACYTEQQAQAIASHIGCVVGMSREVSDDAAIKFAAAFYEALGYGKSVQIAFDLGNTAISLRNFGEEETPKLVATHVNPAEIVFAGLDRLRQALTEGSDDERLDMVQELTRSPQKTLTGLLVERSTADPNPTIRHWINRALGKVGTKRAIKALRRNINDPDPFASLGAQDALKELGEEKGVEDASSQANSVNSTIKMNGTAVTDSIISIQGPGGNIIKGK